MSFPAAAEKDGEEGPKFGHLVKGADDGEGDEPEGNDDEKGDEKFASQVDDGDGDEPPAVAGKYDLKACANDMMGAFQSGDVESLEMALEELLGKVGKK